MKKLVQIAVTLAISVAVDSEYKPADHVADIIETAEKAFPVASVGVKDVNITSDESNLSETV